MQIIRKFLIIATCLLVLTPVTSQATEYSVEKAAVVEVVSVNEVDLGFDNGSSVITQVVQAEFIESGTVFILEEDFLNMDVGDTFFVRVFDDGTYELVDYNRLPGLYVVLGLFILVILIFGARQGLRSLLSLAVSFAVIIFVLLPLLLQGISPILVSMIVAVFLLAFAIFVTHGFKRDSLIAFLGTVVSVLITGVLALVVVDGSFLTGFFAHESTYLDVATRGSLNFQALLMAGILVGMLGVLDDIAITQVSVVRALFVSNKNASTKEVFRLAMGVGKEHVAALVNTLVFAYVGAALPLLLYVSTLQFDAPSLVLNSEIFATEVVRTVLGTIGLVLTVPLVTFAAVWILGKDRKNLQPGDAGHHHYH